MHLGYLDISFRTGLEIEQGNGQQVHEKVLHKTSHEGNANQNQSVISHLLEGLAFKMQETTSVGERCRENGPRAHLSRTVVRNVN